ncbi:MAG: hypothetical protein JNJ46_33840 [Myxococcales bacterium]|nr:hypothetical protein [Myxococcales bacterium]
MSDSKQASLGGSAARTCRRAGHAAGWLGRLGLLGLAACGGTGMASDPNGTVPADPVEQTMTKEGACLPEVSCSGTPSGLSKGSWKHSLTSPLVVASGSPRHRGIDLIATADANEQVLAGEISYGVVDKALEDEEVDVFVCRAGSWQLLGTVVTGSSNPSDGRFELRLRGSDRLPVGRRQVFASVRGDRSSLHFLAVVLPSGGKVAVSDIDGTLTSYENEYPESLVTGSAVKAQDGAAEAFSALAERCYQPVYLTARGSVFTESTRTWLKDRAFPVGPLRLAPNLITLPGETTVEYKASTMQAIQASGVTIAVGNGNRASDAQAYKQIGVATDHIFLKRPEYQTEIDPVIARGDAVGVDSYRLLQPTFLAYPRAP